MPKGKLKINNEFEYRFDAFGERMVTNEASNYVGSMLRTRTDLNPSEKFDFIPQFIPYMEKEITSIELIEINDDGTERDITKLTTDYNWILDIYSDYIVEHEGDEPAYCGFVNFCKKEDKDKINT